MVKFWRMFRENTKHRCNSLESYFLSNFDLDDDPTENDPSEYPSRERRLVNAFKQAFSKLYAMFVQSAVPIFDSFNTFLQADEPLIYILYHSSLHFYCLLLSKFILLKLSRNQMMC